MIPSFFDNRRSSRIFDDPFSFHDVWDPFKGFPLSSSSRATSNNIPETPEAHVFKADLPGVQKDEVKVEIEKEDGENVNMDQVKASMENGFLVVNLPKEEMKKSDVKSIEISG